MERLGRTAPTGINANALKTWGMIFAMAGILGRSILQNRLLGVGTVSALELVEMMQSSEGAMVVATVALIMQAIETCAIPIFAFALVEGFQHTADWKKYFLRLAGVAVLSEIPYNLAMGMKVLDFGSRNPVFGLVLAFVMLCLYRYFAGKKLVCVVATIAALTWAMMLKVEHGVPMLLIVCALWAFRKKPMFRGFIGSAVAVVCTVSSLFYLAAPMGFLAIHLYNGEKGENNRLVSYLFYPVAVLAIGLAAMFLF